MFCFENGNYSLFNMLMMFEYERQDRKVQNTSFNIYTSQISNTHCALVRNVDINQMVPIYDF